MVCQKAETKHCKLVTQCPWGDSNSRERLRGPLLYPLSYRGMHVIVARFVALGKHDVGSY